MRADSTPSYTLEMEQHGTTFLFHFFLGGDRIMVESIFA